MHFLIDKENDPRKLARRFRNICSQSVSISFVTIKSATTPNPLQSLLLQLRN